MPVSAMFAPCAIFAPRKWPYHLTIYFTWNPTWCVSEFAPSPYAKNEWVKAAWHLFRRCQQKQLRPAQVRAKAQQTASMAGLNAHAHLGARQLPSFLPIDGHILAIWASNGKTKKKFGRHWPEIIQSLLPFCKPYVQMEFYRADVDYQYGRQVLCPTQLTKKLVALFLAGLSDINQKPKKEREINWTQLVICQSVNYCTVLREQEWRWWDVNSSFKLQRTTQKV